MKKHVPLFALLSTISFFSIHTKGRFITMSEFFTPLKKYYANKHVLVTGGCGFIGSHVAQALVDLGAHVTILDNLITGNLDNIAHIQDRVTFINGSVADPQICLDATEGKAIIFHLAAFISVPQSTENPSLCHQSNVDGTFNLLESARLHAVDRFIFSSSASVYGTTQEPCSETTPTNPQSPYAWSKLIGEQYCKQYARTFGLKTMSMRYFNVYGERQNPHAAYAAAVAKFKYHMEHNEPVTFFGDGMQTRDFVPVETVAEINLLLGTLPDQELNGDVYNVATGKSITLFELLEMLKPYYPEYDQPIQFAPERAGDVRHAIADCTKLDRLKERLRHEMHPLIMPKSKQAHARL